MSPSLPSTSRDPLASGAPPVSAVVYCEGNFGDPDGKTANGLVRHSERYEISNTSNPPKAQYGEKTFEIALPADAQLDSASATRPGGLGTTTRLIPLSQKGHYTFNVPIQPDQGQKKTRFEVQYHVSYSGKYNFKPTVVQGDAAAIRIDDVSTPASLGAFLSDRRQRLGLAIEVGKPLVLHRGVSLDVLLQLEAGVFASTLDAVFPMADFYQVGRRAFLNCVMRVFFKDELQMLLEKEHA